MRKTDVPKTTLSTAQVDVLCGTRTTLSAEALSIDALSGTRTTLSAGALSENVQKGTCTSQNEPRREPNGQANTRAPEEQNKFCSKALVGEMDMFALALITTVLSLMGLIQLQLQTR